MRKQNDFYIFVLSDLDL